MAPRAQEAILSRTSQDGPQVEDDTGSVQNGETRSAKAFTGRILESILPVLDPVQERLAEQAAQRSRARTITALSGQGRPAQQQPSKVRAFKALTPARKPVQEVLPFEAPMPKDAWPDDVAIHTRRKAEVTTLKPAPSIASSDVASLARERAKPVPQAGAIDVTPNPEIVAEQEAGNFSSVSADAYEPRGYRYNRWQDTKGRRSAPKYAGTVDVTGILHKGEGWKARRLNPRLW